MKSRRAISSMVGVVFFIVVMSSAVGYVSYSVGVIDNLAKSIQVKQTLDHDRTTEEFNVVGISTVSNKFNVTLQNTGNIPVNVTRLWIENTTDSSWPVSKFDVNAVVAPGSTVTNIGQNIDLISLDSQSYFMKLVTSRGNSEKLFLNSVGVGGDSVYLKLHATPTSVATGFTTTLTLEVINTGTNQLLNLQAEMDSVTPSCGSPTCATWVSGPEPTSFSSLDPGGVVTFEWVYTLDGNDADQFTFTASLVNGVDQDSTIVSVKSVEFAENADVSLTSANLNIPTINDSILLFHQETYDVPASTPPNVTYQMYSGSTDGGVDGTLVQLDTVLLSSMFTKNGTDTITIPAGKWNASLYLQSEAMTASLKGEGEDLIFHFEDGSGGNPDNSESDSTRDLENCSSGGSTWSANIAHDDDDTEADDGGTSMDENSSDLEMMYDGSYHQMIGLRWLNVNVPRAENIASATITFTADLTSSGTVYLRFWGQDDDLPLRFSATEDLTVGDRPRTSASFDWDNIGAWTNDLEYTTPLPGITPIIQEIIDRGDWDALDEIVIIVEDNGSDVNTRRRADSHDTSASLSAELTITYGSVGGSDGEPPTYEATAGPHGSGAYKFDGVNDCFRSSSDISAADDNDLQALDSSTSLWFKTDGVGQVSSEQYLVWWDGDGTCPSCDYYKISLGEDNTGKVLFEYNLNQGGASTTTCRSTSEYDDGNWHHVTAVRDQDVDECELYIADINGSNEETINGNDDNADNSIDASGRWLVGGDKNGDGNFKGWIDDIIHWEGKTLTSAEAADLAKTNYGTGAHQLNISLNMTDASGVPVSNVFDGPLTPIAFQDSKNLGDNNDAGYGIFNVTMDLPQVVVSPQQRLNFSMNYVPSTSSWIPLEVDMKIDDNSLSPFPSYLQIPNPDISFLSYFRYDNDDEVDVFITNSGNDGIYFIYTGTRVNFNGTNGAYAGLIHTINGSSPSFDVDNTQDSIYIPAGDKAELFFYIPTDQPSTTAAGTTIPAGTYRTAIWLHGYSDQGETFSRSIVMGTVNVVD